MWGARRILSHGLSHRREVASTLRPRAKEMGRSEAPGGRFRVEERGFFSRANSVLGAFLWGTCGFCRGQRCRVAVLCGERAGQLAHRSWPQQITTH